MFFPPFLLLVAAIALNFYDGDLFLTAITGAYNYVIQTFGWLVSLTAFAAVVVCALAYISPFGRVVLGGPKAIPLLTRKQLFAIVLTTEHSHRNSVLGARGTIVLFQSSAVKFGHPAAIACSRHLCNVHHLSSLDMDPICLWLTDRPDVCLRLL